MMRSILHPGHFGIRVEVLKEFDSMHLAGTALPDSVKRFFQCAGVIPEVQEEGVEEQSAEKEADT
jgi:hypothetical protein